MDAGSEFDGMVCLVTGGSRGIGLAIAREFLVAGGSVVICSRSDEHLAGALNDLTTAESRGQVRAIRAHVGVPEDAVRAVDYAVSELGRLDVLVNNAATNPYFGPLTEITPAAMAKTSTVNVDSVVLWAAAAWERWMRQHGGSIVNVSSVGAFGTHLNIGYYNATKAAVSHLTTQLAAELGPKVRVNAVAPGPVLTELSAAVLAAGEDRISAVLPLRRLGQPEDIAHAVSFLASSRASWVSGVTLPVDGGALVVPSVI